MGLVVAGVCLLGAMAGQAFAATTTVTSIVNGGNVDAPSINPALQTGWSYYAQRGLPAANAVTIVNGPAANLPINPPAAGPLGMDSVQLKNGPDLPAGGQKTFLIGPNGIIGHKLADLTALSFTGLNRPSVMAASVGTYVSLEIDASADGYNSASGAGVTFSGLTYDPLNASPLFPGRWYPFDGMGNGRAWNLSRTITLGTAAVGMTPAAPHVGHLADGTPVSAIGPAGTLAPDGQPYGSLGHPLTYADMKALLPNTKFIISGPQFQTGQSGTSTLTSDQTNNVDGVTIGISGVSTTYDFERAIATTLDADPLLVRFSPFGLPVLSGLTAHLTTAGGVPLAGKTVLFSKAGQYLCAAVTNAAGAANCAPFLSLGQILAILNLGYDAAFLGDGPYQPSSSPGIVIK